MSRDVHLPLGIGLAEVIKAQTVAAGKNGINICLRNYQRCFLVCYLVDGAGSAETFTLAQSSGAAGTDAGTGEKAMTNNVPIFYTNDWGLTEDGGQDTSFAEATAAKAYSTGGVSGKSSCIIFDIEPDICMDVANGFDCVTVNTTGSSASNIGCVIAFLLPRYKPPLTVTIDGGADTGGSKSASASVSASASASESASASAS